MGNIFYKSLPQRENYDQFSVGRAEEECKIEHQPSPTAQQKILLKTLCILFLASLTANIFFVYQQYFVSWRLADELPSKFAHLKYDVPVEIGAHSYFDSTNRTLQDQAWDAPDLEPWNLFLALDDDYSASMNLPSSQRWPWNPHKGSYITTAAHELHCVRVLRSVVNENHDGLPQIDQT